MTTSDGRVCPTCGVAFPARPGKRYCSRKCQVTGSRRTAEGLGLTNVHVVIPDTQIKAGVPNVHLSWIGNYIADRYAQADDVNLTVVHLGDHWDMPSLSSWDKGKRAMEGRRVREDIDAGDWGFELLDFPIRDADWARPPRKVFLRGNHEDRITRAVEGSPNLEGFLSIDQLNTLDWEVHEYLHPVTIDGVVYAHYFYHPNTGKPYSGENLKLRLKTVGHSFTMGHQQTYDHAIRFVNGRKQVGLVAGACYLHDEEYKGPQGNAHWRGIAVCNNVEDGAYDLMEVSLDYLCRRYEGVRLRDFTGPEVL